MVTQEAPSAIVVLVRRQLVEKVFALRPIQVAIVDCDTVGFKNEELVRVPTLLGQDDLALVSGDVAQVAYDHVMALYEVMPMEGSPFVSGGEPAARRAVLVFEEGLVQEAICDGALRVLVLNLDVEGLDPDALSVFPHVHEAIDGTFVADPQWVEPTVDPAKMDITWPVVAPTSDLLDPQLPLVRRMRAVT